MGVVKHVVLLKFKEGALCAEQFFSDALAMTREIPGILNFSCGPSISVEGLEAGFTHAFIMDFEDVAARDVYLPHPVHEAFKAKHLPSLDKVLVIDI